MPAWYSSLFESQLVLGAESFLSNVEVSSDTLDLLRVVMWEIGVLFCDIEANGSFVCFVLSAFILVHVKNLK